MMAPFLEGAVSPTAMSIPTSPGTVLQDLSPDTSSPASSPPPSKKRKRDTKPVPEIEVDVEAPEPPSKKALRKAKRGKPASTQRAPKLFTDDPPSESDDIVASAAPTQAEKADYGIWIGNLPWVASKTDLQKFLTSNGKIEESSITRIHMPAPTQSTVEASRQRIKPQNKGFAYVDFSTESALTAAIALSETLLSGRRVLIKNAKSFEGRPESLMEEAKTVPQVGKPPSKRVFVGNLSFDTTRGELQEHFAKCGEVADCFIATFEDSGKCKGYSWVTFEELESAVKAVRGWVNLEEEDSGDDDEADGELGASKGWLKGKRVRKWWVNRIKGRALRMEFAEDKAVRYKKRFGKGASGGKDDTVGKENDLQVLEDADAKAALPSRKKKADFPTSRNQSKPTSDHRQEKKGYSQTFRPAVAVGTERLTGAIVRSQGKKLMFD